MKLADFKKLKLPDQPGVYFFKQGKKVLYVGKATSLKNRVRSYFSSQLKETRGPRLESMLFQATTVSFEETDSVLEALLLENFLIKKLKPVYNVRERDDKSYWYVVFTAEDFPRVLLVRGRELFSSKFTEKTQKIFGPFPRASELKEALKIIRKIFPFSDKCRPNQKKPCFNYQLGLCPGVCINAVNQKDYRLLIKHITYLFEGRKGKVQKNLETLMLKSAKAKEFEQASKYKKQLFALKHIQDIALIKEEFKVLPKLRFEAFDVAHLAGSNSVGVMVVLEDGELKPSDYRRFIIKQTGANRANDTASLQEILERRFKHEDWPKPNVLVIDGGLAQINTAKKVLKNFKLDIRIVGVVKDEYHRPKNLIGDKILTEKYHSQILLINNEAHRFAINYHRQKRRF